MAKRTLPTPKHWISVTSLDGNRRGDFEVSSGQLTVRFGNQHKTTRAPSTGIPASLGADADRSLAQFMLGEFAP